MSGTNTVHGARVREHNPPRHHLRPEALEWLADLNPQAWRYGGAVSKRQIAIAAGLANTTFWRQANGDEPLSEPVMSALVALAMVHGARESEARRELFTFWLPPEMAAAAHSARRVRRAVARVEAAA